VQEPLAKIRLIPAQRTKLADAQAVPIGEEDHRRVAVAVASSLPRRGDQRLDLGRRQIFARAQRGIASADRWCHRLANYPQIRPFGGRPLIHSLKCPVFSAWHVLTGPWFSAICLVTRNGRASSPCPTAAARRRCDLTRRAAGTVAVAGADAGALPRMGDRANLSRLVADRVRTSKAGRQALVILDRDRPVIRNG